MDEQAARSGRSGPVGAGDVRVPCPVPGCGREFTVLVERAAVATVRLAPDPDEERDFPV